MATEEDLRKKIKELQQQLEAKDESKPPRLVYSKDRKFVTLTSDVDFAEWIDTMEKHVNFRFTKEQEKVYFIFDHLEQDTKAEVKFRCQLHKVTVAELVQILKDKFCLKDSVIEIQQEFYSRNQLKDESFETFAVELMKILNRLLDRKPSLTVDKEIMIKQKFADGVTDPILRRELKRVNQERTISFWELRNHAINWSTGGQETEITEVSSNLVQTDFKDVIDKQQKQIDELTKLVKDMRGLKPNHDSDKKIYCYYCKKEGHIKSKCFKLKKRNESENSRDLNEKYPRKK